jgi:hypothetical protein
MRAGTPPGKGVPAGQSDHLQRKNKWRCNVVYKRREDEHFLSMRRAGGNGLSEEKNNHLYGFNEMPIPYRWHFVNGTRCVILRLQDYDFGSSDFHCIISFGRHHAHILHVARLDRDATRCEASYYFSG